jgi:hypothetical protein
MTLMSSEEITEVFDETFSHRPLAGVSVGVRISGGYAIVAIAFRRRNEQFNRRYVLNILRGRMSVPSRDLVRTFPVPEGTTSKQFMRVFRQSFRSGGPEGGEEDTKDSIGRTRNRESQRGIIFAQLAPYVANEMYTLSNTGATT